MVRGPRNPLGKPIRLGRTAKPPEPPRAKNPYEAANNRALAIQALDQGVGLSIHYRDCDRIVEVHTVGTSTAARPAMSAFQVNGQCNETTIPGWAFFCFDECFDVHLTERPSAAPRPDYKKGAKPFRTIDREV